MKFGYGGESWGKWGGGKFFNCVLSEVIFLLWMLLNVDEGMNLGFECRDWVVWMSGR